MQRQTAGAGERREEDEGHEHDDQPQVDGPQRDAERQEAGSRQQQD